MRSAISQTVKSVLRKGRSARSRRPSGFSRRGDNDSATDVDLGSSRNHHHSSSQHHLNGGGQSVEHGRFLSFRRSSVNSNADASFGESRWPSRRGRRGKSQAMEDNADNHQIASARRSLSRRRLHWRRHQVGTEHHSSSVDSPTDDNQRRTKRVDMDADRGRYGSSRGSTDMARRPSVSSAKHAGYSYGYNTPGGGSTTCGSTRGPSQRRSRVNDRETLGSFRSDDEGEDALDEADSRLTQSTGRMHGAFSKSSSVVMRETNEPRMSVRSKQLSFDVDSFEEEDDDDGTIDPRTRIRHNIPGPRSALSSRGTPTDLTQFFFPKPWRPERFRSLRKLANAIHGEVRCAMDRIEKKHVVVKVIRNASVRPRDVGELENPLIEIGAMTYLYSSRAVYPVDLVAKLHGVYQDSKYTYLVTEHCAGGELFREVVTRKCLPEQYVKAISLQLALALDSLHKNGICHRDVSLENTLIASDRTVRLIDFGQAESIYDHDGHPRLMTGSAGKDYYRAPEMTRGPYHGPPVDVFALGVEIFIMAVGSPPWNEATQNDARYRSLTSRPDSLDIALRKWGKRDQVSDAFVDLLTGIFCTEPEKRPSIEDLFLHPWFALDRHIWNWVDAKGQSRNLPEQADRVHRYLMTHPRGKFFVKPCHGPSGGTGFAPVLRPLPAGDASDASSLGVFDNGGGRKDDGRSARFRRPLA